MAGRLDDRVAVVTGGASGIGKATTFRFCEEGARVMVGDRDAATAEHMLAEAAAAGFGARVGFQPTDVSVEADVAALVAAAVDEFGDLDIVVNNAAVSDSIEPLVDVSVEHWDHLFAVNARGVFLGIKHGARAMQAAGHGGSIINTASIDGILANSGFPTYSAAKAAVINLTRAAAVELAPARIRVNALCPGGILTPMLARGDEEGTRSWLLGLQPWPEVGLPEHVAAVALFLASDDACFVTGEPVIVDGGLMAGGARLRDPIRARLLARMGVASDSDPVGPREVDDLPQ